MIELTLIDDNRSRRKVCVDPDGVEAVREAIFYRAFCPDRKSAWIYLRSGEKFEVEDDDRQTSFRISIGHPAKNALKNLREHWREFGPEHGFDELIERTCSTVLEGKTFARDEDYM